MDRDTLQFKLNTTLVTELDSLARNSGLRIDELVELLLVIGLQKLGETPKQQSPGMEHPFDGLMEEE